MYQNNNHAMIAIDEIRTFEIEIKYDIKFVNIWLSIGTIKMPINPQRASNMSQIMVSIPYIDNEYFIIGSTPV